MEYSKNPVDDYKYNLLCFHSVIHAIWKEMFVLLHFRSILFFLWIATPPGSLVANGYNVEVVVCHLLSLFCSTIINRLARSLIFFFIRGKFSYFSPLLCLFNCIEFPNKQNVFDQKIKEATLPVRKWFSQKKPSILWWLEWFDRRISHPFVVKLWLFFAIRF